MLARAIETPKRTRLLHLGVMGKSELLRELDKMLVILIAA